MPETLGSVKVLNLGDGAFIIIGGVNSDNEWSFEVGQARFVCDSQIKALSEISLVGLTGGGAPDYGTTVVAPILGGETASWAIGDDVKQTILALNSEADG